MTDEPAPTPTVPPPATAATAPAPAAAAAAPAEHGGLSSRLYRGQLSFDIIRHRRRWYGLSAVLIIVALLGIGLRPLHFSVDFTGGNTFQVTVPSGSKASVASVTSAVDSLGVAGAQQPVVTLLTGSSRQVRVQTGQTAGSAVTRIQDTVAKSVGAPSSSVSVESIGSSWGSDITRKAVTSLVVFLVLVMAYLAIAFEWQMGLAAIVSLLHDLVITIGVYAIVGFQVSPATVIGVLTILGYSLYDTVVVFDKVRENTRGIAGGSRSTYSEAANLALNQTFVRSLNTTVIALLPILSILVIGSAVLGPGVLEDLALALAIGIAIGAYSSLLIATPLLAQLREREPAMQALARRVATARTAAAAGDPVAPAMPTIGAPVVATGTGATAVPVVATPATPAGPRPGHPRPDRPRPDRPRPDRPNGGAGPSGGAGR